MTLEEFVSEKKKNIDEFQQVWKKNNQDDPSNWEMDMNEADWEEMFLLFEEEDLT